MKKMICSMLVIVSLFMCIVPAYAIDGKFDCYTVLNVASEGYPTAAIHYRGSDDPELRIISYITYNGRRKKHDTGWRNRSFLAVDYTGYGSEWDKIESYYYCRVDGEVIYSDDRTKLN